MKRTALLVRLPETAYMRLLLRLSTSVGISMELRLNSQNKYHIHRYIDI